MKAIQRFDFFKVFLFGIPLLFIWFIVLLFAGRSLNLAVIFTACSIPPYFIVCFLTKETLGLTTYEPLNFESIVKYSYILALLIAVFGCEDERKFRPITHVMNIEEFPNEVGMEWTYIVFDSLTMTSQEVVVEVESSNFQPINGSIISIDDDSAEMRFDEDEHKINAP